MRKPYQTGFVILLGVVVSFAVFAPSILHAAPATQNTDDPITLEVRAGFGGFVQGGAYFPVTITASNDGEDVSGELRIKSELDQAEFVRQIDLPRGSNKQVTFYATRESFGGNEIQIEFADRGRILAVERVKVEFVRSEDLLIGLLSDTPQHYTELEEITAANLDVSLGLLTVEELPAHGEGWKALDVLVIADYDTGKLSEDQRQAMRDWVSGGGRLIIIGGISYQRTLIGLEQLTPVFANNVTTISLQPIVALTRHEPDPQAQMEAPVATGPQLDDAETLVAGEAPLLVFRRYGYGDVFFFAADPGLNPLKDAEGMATLWKNVLSTGVPRPGWGYGFDSNWESSRQAVGAVPGISLPSILQLCGFLGLYTILVGPVNYFVLWRMKRRELAWLTIPSLVILFSVMAYITGFQLRGAKAIVHRLAVVHVPADSPYGQVDGMMGLWSPRRLRYDIQFEPDYLVRPMPRDIGGALTSVTATTVEQGEFVTLRDVRVDVGAIQPFVVEGILRNPPQFEATLTVKETLSGLQLIGEVINQSDVTLEDASIIFNGQVSAIADVPPGELIRVDIYVDGLSPLRNNPLLPFPKNNSFAGYGYGYSQLIEQIARSDGCYGFDQSSRRCDLLASVMVNDNIGQGIYLLGWSDETPFKSEVLNGQSDEIDLSLYIIELETETDIVQQTQDQISPSAINWEILENPDNVDVGNLQNFGLGFGESLSLRFEPATLTLRGTPSGFILHLQKPDYVEDQSSPLIDVWHVDDEQWVALPGVDWGDITHHDTDYIDSVGGIQLRIRTGAGQYTEFSRFEITLLLDVE